MARKKLSKRSPAQLERLLISALDTNKAEDIVSVDLAGKADFADRMIIASGTSQRHVGALADHLISALKKTGYEHIHVEGQDGCEWVLVDAGNVVVHIFRPETRRYYNLEKMWSVSLPQAEMAY